MQVRFLRWVAVLALALVGVSEAAAPGPYKAYDVAGQLLRRPLPGHREPQVVEPVAGQRAKPYDWRYSLVDVVQQPGRIQVAFRRSFNSHGIPIITRQTRWNLPGKSVRLIDSASYRGDLGTEVDRQVELWTGQR